MKHTGWAEIPNTDGGKIWKAAESLGGHETWGLKGANAAMQEPYMLEPYTLVTTLIQKSFAMIDKIAAATDIAKLFPEGTPVPNLPNGPPQDRLFENQVRERFALLG